MIGLITMILQEAVREEWIPEMGVRISVWFIGIFLLTVGGAVLYLRLVELKQKRKSDNTTGN